MNLNTNASVFHLRTCVCLPEENKTPQLNAAVSEGFEAQLAGRVEMFLVEVYRCKLCQFTSSIESKTRTHLAHMHETDTACQISGCPKMDQDANESYSMGDEVNQENKENKEKLVKMSIFLPMCQMLQNMSPHCYDMSPGSPSNNSYASCSCEVMNTLFGEETDCFQLEEPWPEVPGSFSHTMDSSKSKWSKGKEDAQSVMSLCKCCVSSIRTPTVAEEVKKYPKAESRHENCKNQKKARCDNTWLALPMKEVCTLKLDSERTQHFCNVCKYSTEVKRCS